MKLNTQASGSARWMDCTASATIDVSDLRELSSSYSDRGRYLHAVGERCLREGGRPILGDGLDLDETRNVGAYVDYVRSRTGLKFYEIEGRYAGRRCFADAVIINGDTLEIVDFKSGFVRVSPEKNTQLIIYALAVMDKLGVVLDGGIQNVELTICQGGASTSWSLSIERLCEWREKIERVLKRIRAGKVEYKPSEDNCRWCPAKPICPELDERALKVARADFMKDEPDEMTWAEKMALVPMVIAWAEAVKSEVRKRVLEDPDAVPGYKPVAGRSTREWTSETKVKNLLRRLGFKDKKFMTPSKLVSPAVAEKLLTAGPRASKKKKEEVALKRRKLGELIKTNEGPRTVVPDSDKRPSLSGDGEARSDFAEDISRKEKA